jgi:hypothetical protein
MFPSPGQAGSKLWPALVASVEAFHRRDLGSDQHQPRYHQKPGPGDYPLEHWKAVGLRHPSRARISNLLAVERKLIKSALGTLPAEDLARIEQGLRKAFGL